MLADPCPRPPMYLTDVPGIHLRERIGITRSQELPVRRPSEIASHTLYFAAPRKVCQPRQVWQARQGCRGLLEKATRTIPAAAHHDSRPANGLALALRLSRLFAARAILG